MQPPTNQEIRKMAQIGAILLGFVCFAYYIRKDPKYTSKPVEAAIEPQNISSEKSFTPGTEGSITGVCGCASSEEKYDEMIKYSNAKDDYGLKEMVLSGHLILLEPNTSVKVIDNHFSYLEVRVTSGQNQGAKCCVSRSFVK